MFSQDKLSFGFILLKLITDVLGVVLSAIFFLGFGVFWSASWIILVITVWTIIIMEVAKDPNRWENKE